MTGRSPFENTANAASAWARYRRLMKFMMVITVITVIAAIYAIYTQTGYVSPHFFIATALGIGASMLLMSALMGLVFLSSASGHDERIERFADQDEADG